MRERVCGLKKEKRKTQEGATNSSWKFLVPIMKVLRSPIMKKCITSFLTQELIHLMLTNISQNCRRCSMEHSLVNAILGNCEKHPSRIILC